MATIVLYEIDDDPLGSSQVAVINRFVVEIVDQDPTLERLDSDGSPQLDVSALPDFFGNSVEFETFQSYPGDVDGNPVRFTLLNFGGEIPGPEGRYYMVLTEGSVAVGDTINNVPAPEFAPPIDYVDLPDFLCFTAGSLITTPSGPRLIETISAGDQVNVAEGKAMPVRWVGRRHLTHQEIIEQPSLAPVCISAGAFGEGIPARDIRVSPQHRIALGSWYSDLLYQEPIVLVPAHALIDGIKVCQDTAPQRVDYVHILFDTHQLVEVDGLWSESFYPGPSSLGAMTNRALEELVLLFPDLANSGVGYGAQALPSLKPYETRVVRDDLRAISRCELGKYLESATAH